MMNETRRTIDDIARAARVSIATVSRVLNNVDHPVTAKTRSRVMAAAKKLGYKPNFFARGLMNAATDSVGIIVPFLSNPYHTEIVNAIENELSRSNIFVYLCCSYDDAKNERDYMERLSERRVDALILIEGPSTNTAGRPASLLKFDHPVILVNEHLDANGTHHSVSCAQEPGLISALEHLYKSGRRRIALFRGGSVYSFDLKEALFRKFLEDRGLDPAVCPIIRVRKANEPASVHGSASLIRRLLSERMPPDAVFAGNDLIAHGVLQGALAEGVRVPKDLAIISVDNSIIAEIASPRLTSVDLRMEALGRLTAKTYLTLRDRGFRDDTPIHHEIKSRLVTRETS